MFGGVIGGLTGNKQKGKIKGSVVIMRKSVLGFDVTSISATVMDNIGEFIGNGVTCQLISSTVADPYNDNRGKVCAEASLEQWLTKLPSLTSSESKFRVRFNWEVEKHGVPGAIIVKNNHASEFFLKTITLDDVPGRGSIVFVADSWIYPQSKYRYDRVFFANDTYLPSQMPAALKPYREDELRNLRGDDQQGPYQTHDRVYRYDVYNDLGLPDSGNPRPTLGGSDDLPYPRRCRTGRKPSKTDPNCESTLGLLDRSDIYVPRDERFGHIKKSDFYGYAIKSFVNAVVPGIRTFVDVTPGEYDTFKDVLKLIKDLLPVGGDYLLKLPMPQIIKEDKKAWMSDDESSHREALFDPSKYGDHTSTITAAHIEKNLEGLTVQKALDGNRLYILDHHDNFMPFLLKINSLDGNFIYATRTLLFLRADGTLAPLAIELSLPDLRDGVIAAKSTVHTPTSTVGAEAWVWHIAKAYANVNDYCWHQLISHWLNTHAVMEPFVIATNRQLSVTHPVHKLLQPHYRDTMNINSNARKMLINAGGIFELTVFSRKYSFEISSKVYGAWNFTEQALPDDLIKRGMAVPDPSSPYKVRLLVEDYPYASDGLAIWNAIELWVTEYLVIYYPNDGALQADDELQAWWKEVREVGHADLKDAPWWPAMQTVAELGKSCATIIWIASALHAAVNFGQYPYCGFVPNRPSVSRKPMPVPGTKEYAELEKNPEKVFLRTITSQFQALVGLSLLEILSSHSDEVYLGQRDTPEWTSDAKAQDAFKRFGERLVEIENRVTAMNADPRLKNRNGPAKFPYTLLYPNTSDKKGDAVGITAKGIPNSISI
ncbi:Linoleate 9S-lipoxygenase 2 [Dichanthelium oligosanthes]|uniref:Lipoxygenase n=1 Tax=Dichanthelium oligosanthes TaxID=888268 RepID=A0A1E5WAZ3_9POAL|nr:Linoleate 9S-lipoxygenase 2 [Dichanthelium oligosanthes]